MMRKLGTPRRLLLDLVPAVMLGAAVAFLAAVAPLDLIERLVARSHLALLLPQARPPIGNTGRALIVGALGAGAALAAFAAALCLGRFGQRHSVPPSVVTPVQAPLEPVLRRADRHPDAPSKRPVFARDELGMSFDTTAKEPGLHPEVAAPTEAEIPPVAARTEAPTAQPRGSSLADLLARLERGVDEARPLRHARG